MTRRGKIVCTLGPATGTDDMVRALVEAGMDVARLNFSHGDHADHEASYQRVRRASEATGHAVGILADLQGRRQLKLITHPARYCSRAAEAFRREILPVFASPDSPLRQPQTQALG